MNFYDGYDHCVIPFVLEHGSTLPYRNDDQDKTANLYVVYSYFVFVLV
jgi:hypothetical protein